MGVPLGKFQILEDFINKLLTAFSLWFKEKVQLLTPSKVKKSINRGQELHHKKKTLFKDKVSRAKTKSLQTLIHSKDKVNHFKEKSLEVVDQARQTDIRSLSFKKTMLAIGALLAPVFIKFKTWYLTLKPVSIASFITVATVGTLASMEIYVQANKISKEAKRGPASELAEEVQNATQPSRRPAYYKRAEKQFKVTNVTLPAVTKDISTGGKKIRKLVIDFTFESSNKYIKQYLWSRPYLIQDTLNSNIEPISIDFPLKTEGKVIVKEKIKKEMNALLKGLQIKGKIKNIYIASMIGA